MNQEKIQNVFIGLLALGLILVGGGMYLFGMQLQSVATSVKGIQVGVAQLQAVKPVVTAPSAVAPVQNKIATLNSCKTADEAYIGLCFDYPSGWILTSFNDEFTPQNKDLRITSAPGRLFSAESSGGPGEPGVVYFLDGYQINIKTITLGEPKDYIGAKLPEYTFIYSPKEVCNEVGCPNRRVFFSDPGYTYVFEIDINYTVDESTAQPFIETILRNMETGA